MKRHERDGFGAKTCLRILRQDVSWLTNIDVKRVNFGPSLMADLKPRWKLALLVIEVFHRKFYGILVGRQRFS